jgi:PleD family two-component response regulator
MDDTFVHEIELYFPEAFKMLLEHEVNRSRRDKNPLTMIHLAVETEPDTPQARHGAELFAINVLNIHLRETDIPCRNGSEFLVLMPSTGEAGGRVACERLEKRFDVKHQSDDRVSFKISVFIGMATLPGDKLLSSAKLLEQASQALQFARTKRSAKAVIFSEMKQ